LTLRMPWSVNFDRLMKVAMILLLGQQVRPSRFMIALADDRNTAYPGRESE